MKTMTRVCVLGCGYGASIDVPDGAIARYNAGALAQDAFPFLDPDAREFFIVSGICPACYDGMFGEP